MKIWYRQWYNSFYDRTGSSFKGIYIFGTGADGREKLRTFSGADTDGNAVFPRSDRNVYQLFPETKCAIYEIKVTEEQYKEASEFVKNMWRKRRRMTYNVPGVVTANFNHYPNFPNAYYCTQFVALVLQHIGVEFTDKSYREVQVVDFMESKSFHLIYQGELRDYWNANCVGDGYSQY